MQCFLSLHCRSSDGFQNSFRFLQRLVGPEAEYEDVAICQYPVADFVTLPALGSGMMATVHLYGETRLMAEEVQHEGWLGMLTTEFQAL